MFQKVDQARFLEGEHDVLRLWRDQDIFGQLKRQNAGKPKWSFLDGPITANNPMGVHHAWGRTYKDAYQRYHAMQGKDLRYQNGFDCQGLWVEVEVEKQLNLGTKSAIEKFGIDTFTRECKKRVLKYAARQTEQSIRLGYWMEWDHPDELRKLAEGIIGKEDSGSRIQDSVEYVTARGEKVTGDAELLTARLGNPEWGGSYFTFSTENNETIWSFLKKCFERKKIYRGHDVMPWSGRGGSAYSQMEVADGRKLTTHKSVFVRFPIIREASERAATEHEASASAAGKESTTEARRNTATGGKDSVATSLPTTHYPLPTTNEYLLIWTTTPWTLTSNVAAAVNPELDYLKIRTKKDGAIYYFAKDNLNFKRLEKEFKEGFGRPEWQWPEGVGKLKSISQIFKEQGGYEELATLKGAEMVGWRYEGPFDDLPAQNSEQEDANDGRTVPTGVEAHRVIDGGRDSKGSPNVVAGEGTGIVHIAPGCGDVDHKIGVELGLPVIAPLGEDGTYQEGFGIFTGRNAVDPATAELVFEELKKKDLLVSVETYPHIYPFCWRTGDELVFRLVDEWFIDMDWRDEIKDVTKCIKWIPDSIQGEERELEWLTTMRDWMISKKRFWGLALPIWINPDDPSDFEVIGSLAELKERAVEGWDEFEGHTPHRPWIDKVKIKSTRTGAVLNRIEDVGNPWLDAGIVPFSTLNYNKRYSDDLLRWEDWYPADFVTECFPGQFRNWFYSLLSLATMMRYDETENPEEKKPFKNLLGHRLVMDESGKPMHKSDGTAIWFEEAAEQLGVDTLRWMYLAQNPAVDLKFGTRHRNEPVALLTVDGEITQTKEGLQTCKVTSKPADDIRRQVLIPLWNSYAFFVNYAVLDEFDPTLPQVPLKERPEIDRWVLSRLQQLISVAQSGFENYRVADFMQSATAFIDDLSNWYIRRNRRRFWKSRSEHDASASAANSKWDSDKLSAYQTLYEVLVTLTKLLAPAIPFLTERMYQNLVTTAAAPSRDTARAQFKETLAKNGLKLTREKDLILDSVLSSSSVDAEQLVSMFDAEDAKVSRSTVYRTLSQLEEAGILRVKGEAAEPQVHYEWAGTGSGAPASVHLCEYPQVDESKLDAELNWKTQQVQALVTLGHRLRESAEQRVRQPLAELRFASHDARQAEALEQYRDIIADELNVKSVVRAENLDDLVSYSFKPNLKTLGPKYGKLLNPIRTELGSIDPKVLVPLRSGASVDVTIGGEAVTLAPEDVLVSVQQASDWASADSEGIQVALSTKLTEELVHEGMARDLIRQVQQLRKDANLEENQRIEIQWSAAPSGDAALTEHDALASATVNAVITTWRAPILAETRADEIVNLPNVGDDGKRVALGDVGIVLAIRTR